MHDLLSVHRNVLLTQLNNQCFGVLEQRECDELLFQLHQREHLALQWLRSWEKRIGAPDLLVHSAQQVKSVEQLCARLQARIAYAHAGVHYVQFSSVLTQMQDRCCKSSVLHTGRAVRAEIVRQLLTTCCAERYVREQADGLVTLTLRAQMKRWNKALGVGKCARFALDTKCIVRVAHATSSKDGSIFVWIMSYHDDFNTALMAVLVERIRKHVEDTRLLTLDQMDKCVWADAVFRSTVLFCDRKLILLFSKPYYFF